MESANIHHEHHQLQDKLVGSSSSSSSSLPTPSCYGVASPHAWTPTPNVTLNAGNFNPSYNGVLNSRQKNEILLPPPITSMIQESGLHWDNSAGSLTSQSSHDIHLEKIKEEFSDSFPKFTEMLTSPSSIEDSPLTTTSYLSDLSEKLLLKTISSGFPINGNQFSSGDFYSNAHNISSFGSAMPSRGNFSQIYPSINISNFNQSSSVTSSNFHMNLQALDLLTSARFSGNFSQPSHYNLGIYKDSLPFGFDHTPQSTRRPSCSPINKISSPFTDSEITEAKRPSGGLRAPRATQSAPNKKSKLESRTSSPPFKVRKEKLGDRIAALQQLVAPFGKTDTASVLMEAIGYIKFLQNQVENFYLKIVTACHIRVQKLKPYERRQQRARVSTLSVPYMKSSGNKSSRSTQRGSAVEDGNEEPKRDLRSRGLCLVPLSCMSYVTNDAGGGGIWPPPNFGEGT